MVLLQSSFYIYKNCSLQGLKNLPEVNLLASGRAGTETPTLSFNKYCLSVYFMAGTMQGTGDRKIKNKIVVSTHIELAHLAGYANTNKCNISTTKCAP